MAASDTQRRFRNRSVARPPGITDRAWWVFFNHVQGATYAEVGEAWGISKERARQLVEAVAQAVWAAERKDGR